jgi:hypothetical protein
MELIEKLGWDNVHWQIGSRYTEDLVPLLGV